MKKFILTFVIATIVCSLSLAQTEERTYNPTYRKFLVSAGYIPNSDLRAFKGMIMFNNLIKKRVGVYYSFENGIDNYSEHILGGTFGINKYAFLYAGLGLDKDHNFSDARYNDGHLRKEAGVGLTPYKSTAATIGWSRGVGFTFTVGLNFPLRDKRDKTYSVPRKSANL